jgi:hypothetical protein
VIDICVNPMLERGSRHSPDERRASAPVISIAERDEDPKHALDLVLIDDIHPDHRITNLPILAESKAVDQRPVGMHF